MTNSPPIKKTPEKEYPARAWIKGDFPRLSNALLSFRAWATNFPEDGAVAYISKPEVDALIASARAEEFDAGMRHVTVPRGKVSVHGTDGCFNCDTGRITIYAASRYCPVCEAKQSAALPKEGDMHKVLVTKITKGMPLPIDDGELDG